jgi:Spy/CpxP family protein refolding chaperone
MALSLSRPDLQPSSRRRSCGLRGLLGGAAFAAVLAASGLAAFAQPAAAMQASAGHADTGGLEDHGGMRHGARAKARISRMLTDVNATPEQRTKIDAIMKGAFDQIGPLHKKMEEGRRELHRLLSQPTIDRNALERVRAARIADLDQSSKIMVKALADSAEVLTPAQRTKLANLEEARRSARRQQHRRP